MWQESKTNDDIKSFMDLVCRFHDECIKDWINNCRVVIISKFLYTYQVRG